MNRTANQERWIKKRLIKHRRIMNALNGFQYQSVAQINDGICMKNRSLLIALKTLIDKGEIEYITDLSETRRKLYRINQG